MNTRRSLLSNGCNHEMALRSFERAVARVPETRVLFDETCEDLLGGARAMLEGKVEYRKGEYARAFAAVAGTRGRRRTLRKERRER